MAKLSNINGKFAVEDTGAIRFSDQTGTTGQILKSNGNSAPTWVDPNTVGTGPWLPLAGGIVSGATTFQSSLTIGGTAVFNGDMTLPAAADHFLIGAGSLQTTGRIKFGLPSWNNSIGLESYWMVMRSNSNEGYKFIDSGGNTYVQFNAGTNSSGANYSYFKGRIGIGTDSPDDLLTLSSSTCNYTTAPILRFDSTCTDSANIRNWAIGPADSSYGNFHIFKSAARGGDPVNTAGIVATINYIGNVGIGTYTPTARFNVKASGSTVDQIAVTHSGNTVEIAQLGQSANGNSAGALLLKTNGGTVSYTHLRAHET